jgi:hypothetical protein
VVINKNVYNVCAFANNIPDLQWHLNMEPLNQNTSEYVNDEKITEISASLTLIAQ